MSEQAPHPGAPPAGDDARVLGLARAYLDAEYRWRLEGCWHALEVGLPPGREFARAHPDAGRCGLVSAWNPQSLERAEALNREADAAMQAALEATGLQLRPAFSAARNRSWREPGWLVLDIPAPMLDALARRFGQLGALHWERGGTLRLRMYAPAPDSAQALPDSVDWLGAGPSPQA